MGLRTIIGMDLGKFNSVACVMDAGTRRHSFASIVTTPQATSINPLRDERSSTRCSE